jgi:hypothetical protein
MHKRHKDSALFREELLLNLSDICAFNLLFRSWGWDKLAKLFRRVFWHFQKRENNESCEYMRWECTFTVIAHHPKPMRKLQVPKYSIQSEFHPKAFIQKSLSWWLSNDETQAWRGEVELNLQLHVLLALWLAGSERSKQKRDHDGLRSPTISH